MLQTVTLILHSPSVPLFNYSFADGGNAPGNIRFPFPPFAFPLGADMMEEPGDPKRAKTLVGGLEEVPAGLVKRMERAGGPGTSRGEIPTCSVCWESLLNPEGGGFEGNVQLAKEEADAEAAREEEASRDSPQPSQRDDSPSSLPSQPTVVSAVSSPSDEGSSDTAGDESPPKIVVLPCAHAFHASCLLPWFSKPGRTTCPSCRFDIDPDSLTYRRRWTRGHAHPQAQMGPLPPGALPQFFTTFFGQHPPPPAATTAGPTQPSQPPPAPAPVNISGNPADAPAANAAGAQPAPAEDEHRQRRQQPLPPFIMFDVSMIIPIIPGRGPGGAAPADGPPPQGAQTGGDTAQGPAPPPPPPPRTDRNGFRLDDTLLQQEVRATFERVFGRPLASVGNPPPPAGADVPGEDAAPGGDEAPQLPPFTPQWFTFEGNVPFPPMPPMQPGAHPPRSEPRRRSSEREKRSWAPPPAPGPTLRQIIERNEREMGLRCSDVSCGVGPSDDDDVSMSPALDFGVLRQIAVRPSKADASGRDSVCEHRFHPACLVSAGRVAGWGHEEKVGEPAGEDEDVEVSCPVCRSVGVISRTEWEEGACALA